MGAVFEPGHGLFQRLVQPEWLAGRAHHRAQPIQALGRHQQVGVLQEEARVETLGDLADGRLGAQLGRQLGGEGREVRARGALQDHDQIRSGPELRQEALQAPGHLRVLWEQCLTGGVYR